MDYINKYSLLALAFFLQIIHHFYIFLSILRILNFFTALVSVNRQ